MTQKKSCLSLHNIIRNSRKTRSTFFPNQLSRPYKNEIHTAVALSLPYPTPNLLSPSTPFYSNLNPPKQHIHSTRLEPISSVACIIFIATLFTHTWFHCVDHKHKISLERESWERERISLTHDFRRFLSKFSSSLTCSPRLPIFYG